MHCCVSWFGALFVLVCFVCLFCCVCPCLRVLGECVPWTCIHVFPSLSDVKGVINCTLFVVLVVKWCGSRPPLIFLGNALLVLSFSWLCVCLFFLLFVCCVCLLSVLCPCVCGLHPCFLCILHHLVHW